MKRTVSILVFVGGLAALAGCGGSSASPPYVYGTLLDPEKFLYARLGLLKFATGATDRAQTGLCWEKPCGTVNLFRYKNADGTALSDTDKRSVTEARKVFLLSGAMVGTIEDEHGHGAMTDGNGDFLLPVNLAGGGHGRGGNEIHLMGHARTGYRDTINLEGVHLEGVHGDAHGAAAFLCPDNGMMAKLGAAVLDAGVFTVLVTDDKPGLDFGLVHKGLMFDLMTCMHDETTKMLTCAAPAAAPLQLNYWFFDEKAGWVVYQDPSQAQMDQKFMSMVSVTGFDGHTVLQLTVTHEHKTYTYSPIHAEPHKGALSMLMVHPARATTSGGGGHGP